VVPPLLLAAIRKWYMVLEVKALIFAVILRYVFPVLV